jgi:hypothetical protein
MLRTNLWNDSASRVALDQRAREAHLQLDRIERLLVPRAPVTPSRRRRLLRLFKVGILYGEWKICRALGPLRNRRPLRTRTIPEVWLEPSGSCR